MKTVNLLLLLVLIATVTWSCSDSSTPASAIEALSDTGPYEKAKRVTVQGDSLAGLAQQIPGFGGVFINESEQLSIYLTDPENQLAQAETVLSNADIVTQALLNTSASVSNMEVLKGQYTFIELNDWKKEVSGNVLPMDDVYSSGIDHSRNKLSIGVKDETVAAKVNEKLAELDIPKEAAMMYQMTEPQYY